MSTEPRKSEEPQSFEAAQRELEEIVQRLESGKAGVEEAIELWKRGEELYRFCAARLAAAEGAVEELSRDADSR